MNVWEKFEKEENKNIDLKALAEKAALEYDGDLEEELTVYYVISDDDGDTVRSLCLDKVNFGAGYDEIVFTEKTETIDAYDEEDSCEQSRVALNEAEANSDIPIFSLFKLLSKEMQKAEDVDEDQFCDEYAYAVIETSFEDKKITTPVMLEIFKKFTTLVGEYERTKFDDTFKFIDSGTREFYTDCYECEED